MVLLPGWKAPGGGFVAPKFSHPLDTEGVWSSVHRKKSATRSSTEPLEWEHRLKTLDHQRTNPREYHIVRIHSNTRPGITQPPVAPCAPSSKQQAKQKYKPNH